jgi:hypothetical protein
MSKDPIRFEELLLDIKKTTGCRYLQILQNDPRNLSEPTMLIQSNQTLVDLILKHTDRKVFGNAPEEAIVAYGLTRLTNSKAFNKIPPISNN